MGVLTLCTLMELSVVAPVSAGEEPASPGQQEALDASERLRSERRVNAKPLTLVSPFYSVDGRDKTILYALNTFSDPMDFDLAAVNSGGETFPLGRFTVEPTQHLAISLGEHLGAAPASFKTGSLRLDFTGDFDMFHGWLVLERGETYVEVPMTSVGKSQAVALTSFWDVRPLGGRAVPVYYLFNAGTRPMHLTLSTGKGAEESRSHDGNYVRLLAPGGRMVFSPLSLDRSLKAGILRISHDGNLGSLAVTGLLESDRFLAPLLVAEPGSSVEFLAVRVSSLRETRGGGRTGLSLSIFNTASQRQRIQVSLLDSKTGVELAARDRQVEAGSIASLDLLGMLAATAAEGGIDFRLKVRGEQGLLVQGWSELSGGELVEVPFVPRESAHQNGTYPLPSLDQHEVFATFVNVGSMSAQLAVQIYWDRGSYAPQPITVPAGESFRLSIAEFVEKAAPDLLGRTLDPSYAHGFMQWTTQAGSHEIIARTEVRELGAEDTYGYNCYSCCPENSYAALVPSFVDFDIPEHPSFQAVEYIYTCNGTLGPFPAVVTGLTYSSPISWDGTTITTAGLTSQTVGFSGAGETTVYGIGYCSERPITIRANGPVIVDKCHAQNARDIDLTKACSQQTGTCDSCFDCCEKVKKVGYCRCEQLPLGVANCKAGIDAQKITCRNGCVASVCGE